MAIVEFTLNRALKHPHNDDSKVEMYKSNQRVSTLYLHTSHYSSKLNLTLDHSKHGHNLWHLDEKIDLICYTIFICFYKPSASYPSSLQTTCASGISHPSSHTVCHSLLMHTSTLPSLGTLPPTRRTAPVS